MFMMEKDLHSVISIPVWKACHKDMLHVTDNQHFLKRQRWMRCCSGSKLSSHVWETTQGSWNWMFASPKA